MQLECGPQIAAEGAAVEEASVLELFEGVGVSGATDSGRTEHGKSGYGLDCRTNRWRDCEFPGTTPGDCGFAITPPQGARGRAGSRR